MTLIVPDHVLPLQRERFAEFFLLFARFEFALKAGGFAKAGWHGEAEVDLNEFSGVIGQKVFKEGAAQIQAAVAYLEGVPPKQEIYQDGKLGWKDRPAPKKFSRTRALMFYMYGARNNLIHGAKFLEKESQDANREKNLLEAAEVLITYFVEASPSVNRAFNG